MQAIIFEDGKIEVKDIDIPDRKKGESLIRVLMSGICNTDLEILKGYMAFSGVPGHEFVGIVEESENKNLRGKRVVGEINIGCGNCNLCQNGLSRHCAERAVLGILEKDGAFAEYLTLPDKNLHLLPNNITDEEGVFIEPLAAAFEIFEQVNIKATDKIAVLGDGKLGLLICQVLHSKGIPITLFGHHPDRKEIIGERVDFYESINLEQKKCFDIVIEVTGSVTGLKAAIELVRPQGKIILKSTLSTVPELNINEIVINEITLIGSRCGLFPPAIDLLKKKKIDLNKMISGVYKISEGKKAFKNARQAGVLKVIFRVLPKHS